MKPAAFHPGERVIWRYQPPHLKPGRVIRVPAVIVEITATAITIDVELLRIARKRVRPGSLQPLPVGITRGDHDEREHRQT